MGGIVKDITGKKFNKLTVISFSELRPLKDGNRRAFWLCKCDCGKSAIVKGTNLINGGTKSCGCIGLEKITKLKFKHGLCDKTEYSTWATMRNRCYNKNNKDFNLYGGRGITVSERWKNSFLNFLNDMGKKPSKNHSIDRIENNGNYTKENCRWATISEQSKNRRTNRTLEYNGEKMILNEWAKTLEINEGTLRLYLKNNSFKQIVEWIRQKSFAA